MNAPGKIVNTRACSQVGKESSPVVVNVVDRRGTQSRSSAKGASLTASLGVHRMCAQRGPLGPVGNGLPVRVGKGMMIRKNQMVHRHLAQVALEGLRRLARVGDACDQQIALSLKAGPDLAGNGVGNVPGHDLKKENGLAQDG